MPTPETLPPIIPVIVHHSETGWTAPARFQGLFDPNAIANPDLRRLTPEFDVLRDDISFTSDDENGSASGRWCTAVLPLSRRSPQRHRGGVAESVIARHRARGKS